MLPVRLSHVVRCAVVRVWSKSALPFHLYPVVTCLSHVVCCTFDTAMVSVAHFLLHVYIICSLCSIYMLHIEGSTSSVPHCPLHVLLLRAG